MRWFYTAIVVIFAVIIVIFALQNFEPVTLRFLGLSLQAPMAVFAIVVYLLGMATGSSLLGLVRSSYRKSRPHQG